MRSIKILQDRVQKAIKIMLNDQLIAFPTEGVFGLGASGYSSKGCEALFNFKNRSRSNPLILHVANIPQAIEFADFSDEALSLAKKFWPGGLTMILPIKKYSNSFLNKVYTNISVDNVVAVRVIDNFVALNLISALGSPIAGSSANLSGEFSIGDVETLRKKFASKIYLLDYCVNFGIESTIIDFTNTKEVKIVRPGIVCKEALINAIDVPVYAKYQDHKMKFPLEFDIKRNTQSNDKTIICINFGKSNLIGDLSYNFSEKGCLYECAANFYKIIDRVIEFISNNASTNIEVVISEIPRVGLGDAINYKLQKLPEMVFNIHRLT